MELATNIADDAKLLQFDAGTSIIEQGTAGNDVYLLLSGSVDIIVNGRQMARRFATDLIGEMSAIEPSLRRSASAVASEDTVVAVMPQNKFIELGDLHPYIFRHISRELAKKLYQRNAHVSKVNETIRVFIMSSVEALSIARAIQNAFKHDQINAVVWTDGVFKVAQYPLESLEVELVKADFAVAIAHDDDITKFRGDFWPSPRDNVVFELGLFMGYIGRHRAILMEPTDEQVKLPTDLAGLTTISYKFSKEDMEAYLAPACNELRDHILTLGPNR